MDRCACGRAFRVGGYAKLARLREGFPFGEITEVSHGFKCKVTYVCHCKYCEGKDVTDDSDSLVLSEAPSCQLELFQEEGEKP